MCKVVTILEDKQINQALSSFIFNASIYFTDLVKNKRTTNAVYSVFDNLVAVSCDLIARSLDEVFVDIIEIVGCPWKSSHCNV